MLNIGYPEIQADTLEEVVEHALDELKGYAPLVIDDSGLFIDALKGFPGVYSSYVMRTLGCAGILKLMDGTENRNARFECIIGCMDAGGDTRIFKGTVHGDIAPEARGKQGFGYDPVFIPWDYHKTFAEMSTKEKNGISHRGRATEALLEYLELIP